MTASSGNDRQDAAGRVSRQQILREVAAFAFTVGCAYLQRWQARDLIWGLWASSLCVGSGFILVEIARRARRRRKEFSLGIAIVGALFSLQFFAIHFGGFHYLHGCFLNDFFPLRPDKPHANYAPWTMLSIAWKSYWPMVLATAMSRWREFLPPDAPAKGLRADSFAKPYVNVIRMHMLIFLFAGLSIAGAVGLALYPVLAVYFFPWSAVFGRRGGVTAPKTPRRPGDRRAVASSTVAGVAPTSPARPGPRRGGRWARGVGGGSGLDT